MNGLPYYPRYPRDLIEGTLGMPLELKGAYSVLIDLIYLRNGELVDDARSISGVLGCSVRKWNSIRSDLISRGKIEVNDGFISNSRAVIELEKLRKLQEKNAQNRRRPNKNKDLESRPFNHTDTDTDTDKENKKLFSLDAVSIAAGERYAARHEARRLDFSSGEGSIIPLPGGLERG